MYSGQSVYSSKNSNGTSDLEEFMKMCDSNSPANAAAAGRFCFKTANEEWEQSCMQEIARLKSGAGLSTSKSMSNMIELGQEARRIDLTPQEHDKSSARKVSSNERSAWWPVRWLTRSKTQSVCVPRVEESEIKSEIKSENESSTESECKINPEIIAETLAKEPAPYQTSSLFQLPAKQALPANRSQVAGQATAKLKTPDSSSMAVRDREVASADSSQQPNLTFDAKVQVALQPDLKTEDAPVAFDFRKAHAQLDMTLNKHLEEMKAKLLVLEAEIPTPCRDSKQQSDRRRSVQVVADPDAEVPWFMKIWQATRSTTRRGKSESWADSCSPAMQPRKLAPSSCITQVIEEPGDPATKVW